MTSLKSLGRASAVVACSALLLAACGGQTGATGSSTTPTPTPTVAAAPVVLAQAVAGMGIILVAASNGLTVYNFSRDTPGVSNCTGGCITNWPPLTVASGQKPTGGPGVTGQLGTITRSDGSRQVTYKGLPLYFFHSDTKPGDTKGNYTGWSLVHP